MTKKNKTEESADVRETFTLSSGVVIRCKAVPTDIWIDAMSKVDEPKPPVVHIEDTGRYEENDSDPDYLAAKKAYLVKRNNASKRAVYLLGIEIVTTPADMVQPDSEAWEEERAFLGYTKPGKRESYYDWLRIVAAPSGADMALIMRECGRLTGVRETDALEALKSA